MIFLIGLPGNEQEKLAKQMAEYMDFLWIDLSILFEKTYNKLIYKSYEEDGAKETNRLLYLALITYMQTVKGMQERAIICMPRGIVLYEDLMEYIVKEGNVIYVKNKDWYKNIYKIYKRYPFFKDIKDSEFIKTCILIEEEFNTFAEKYKKCTLEI